MNVEMDEINRLRHFMNFKKHSIYNPLFRGLLFPPQKNMKQPKNYIKK
jgi:hypothetical protein